MIRVKFSEGTGEHWTNYYGGVSKNIWNCEVRRAGLTYVMSQGGMRLEWQPGAWCFPDDVGLVDMVLDRLAHRVAMRIDERHAASRERRRK